MYIHSREERTPESCVRPSILSHACGLAILLRNTLASAHSTHSERTLETNRSAHSMPLCQAFRTSGSSLQEVLVGWTDLKSYSIPCRASLWLETLEDVPVPNLPMEEETKLREHAKQP